MSSPLPDLIDPWRAVDTRAVFAGRLPLSSLARLSAVLLDTAGDVVFRLAFRRDEDHRAVVLGEVKARLELRCQRCLEALAREVDARVALALVRGMDEARQLPERYDPFLVSETLIRPRDLIEDELLLALPQIPMHDPGTCTVASQGPGGQGADGRTGDAGPFAALTEWKSEH